jgi:hypothetical protein
LSTFSTEILNTMTPTELTASVGNMLATEEFHREIREFFEVAVPLSPVESYAAGTLMQARIPADELFEPGSIAFRDDRDELVQRIARSMSRRVEGLRYEVEFSTFTGRVLTDEGGGATSSPGDATSDTVEPATGDEEAIQRLARRSIEVLPAGQWPSLYDSFTSEFQQRCSREQFEQVGEDAAIQLGDDLRLLRFKRTESMTIEGSSAQAVIVGEIVGQSEYQIQATFQKEDGAWKIAPAPDTQGCEAFLSG